MGVTRDQIIHDRTAMIGNHFTIFHHPELALEACDCRVEGYESAPPFRLRCLLDGGGGMTKMIKKSNLVPEGATEEYQRWLDLVRDSEGEERVELEELELGDATEELLGGGGR
eukprot:GHVU01052444.1.p1 GENE.GHVU01052444.1~~GHVU01052444.1.p1  ORF type:complete len:113 (+),score=16.27 GHVU01052444.1:263-601(+)